MGDEAVNFRHLMECADPQCVYCYGGENPHSERLSGSRLWPGDTSAQTERLERLADFAEALWDVGALPVGHPFKQAA